MLIMVAVRELGLGIGSDSIPYSELFPIQNYSLLPTPYSLAQSLIHAHGRRRREAAIRPDAADAVPRKLLARRLPLPFVALEEAGHEEFLRQRRQLDAAGLAVADQLVRVVEADDLDRRARLRRV